ncbi:hypothetical protein JANLI_58150 [Janthinobacterium lividum]|nr:hypothetical protein JANLI_58150 [Janthinobacterium lividum]
MPEAAKLSWYDGLPAVPTSRTTALPASAGATLSTFAAVNGPPVAPAVRSTLTVRPATTVALWLATCGIGLTEIVDVTGAEVPNTFDTV